MKKISILCLAMVCFLFAQSQIRYLKGNLQGSQETPANTSTGSGVVIVKYNTATKALELFGDYAGLTNTITGSHIHRGEPGVAGPIELDLVNSGGTTGSLSGKATLTQPQEDSLIAGEMYANVHTSTNPGGELRAQLTLTTDAQTTFLSGRLQGAQETPPNPSPGTGSVYAIIDMATDSAFVTGNYTGLTAASTGSHVHTGSPTVAGAILFDLIHSSATSGSVHGITKVTAEAADSISTNGTYVNIHTSTYAGGEIRAQLVNNTTVRYFAGEMNGSNEVPSNSSKARGTVIVVYNTETNLLTLAGDYQHLSDTVSAAHIHMGAPGVSGAPIIPLTTSGDSTGTIAVTGVTLTDAQEIDLLAGNMYANVHSAAFPNGEIRAQLIATTSGETQAFSPKLDGTQEVPSNTSTATGQALVIVDKATGLTYATGFFNGVNSNVSKADISRGQVGVNGPVILALNPAYNGTTKSGTFSGSGTLSSSLVDSMINGFTYISINSQRFPEGVIRGQLGDLVLPVKLTYLNAYKQKNQIELIWETSEELNLSRYEIEQLNTTTQQWTSKGTVFAKGGSGPATYNFIDNPNVYGNKYMIYRLKMTDKNGRITYSYMVKVNFEKLKAELFIQTNPVANGELKYTITGLTSGKKAEVSIIDYNGRLILKNAVSSLMNNTIRIPQLAKGMYKLIVRIDDTVLEKGFIK